MKKEKQYAKAAKNIKPGDKHTVRNDLSGDPLDPRDPKAITLLNQINAAWQYAPTITQIDGQSHLCLGNHILLTE